MFSREATKQRTVATHFRQHAVLGDSQAVLRRDSPDDIACMTEQHQSRGKETMPSRVCS
jgi:hypothetical protein